VSRRVTLPGADELFRATGHGGRAVAAEPEMGETGDAAPAPAEHRPSGTVAALRPPSAGRRPSGREKHDEKITVYVSPTELVDLERARLTLRADHGLAVDRGRIVREAVALVIADLEAKGADSILVRRLRDR
jgi:hypothetical protein